MRRLLGLIVLLVLATGLMAAKKVAPLIRPLTVPYETTQGLPSRQIALWGSHGMYYNDQQDRWMWQRARVWTTVEDLFTTSFIAPYLVPMLEQAGAVVMQPRAYVRPGYQSVYIRWSAKQKKPLQTITLSQGTNTYAYQINTAIGIGLWHYLCTLPKGDFQLTGVEYMTIDESTLGPSGRPRFMEAARYWVPYIGVPDTAWFKDSTYNDYLNDIIIRGGWVNYLCGGSAKRPKKMGVGIPLDLSIAIHTDAGVTMNDSLIGSMAIYTKYDDHGKRIFPNKQPRSLSAALADSVLQQLVHDLRFTYTPDWPLRELKHANYGETRIPQVPSMLIEMLSHQNYADMRLALDPMFRFTASRAIYKGIGHYLAKQYNQPFVPQPLAPKALRTTLIGDSIRLSWRPQIDSIEPLATPTYYVVYTRENGANWDMGHKLDTTFFSLSAQPGTQYDFYVAAGNAGGISLPSAIVSACLASNSQSPLFIIDAFPEVRAPHMLAFDSLTGGIVPGSEPIPDGLEMAYIGPQINYNRQDPWHSDDDCGFGMCSMQFQGQFLVGNTHDYTAQHGRAWAGQRSYVSCTFDALSMADTIYHDVDVILGKSQPATVHLMLSWIELLGYTDSLYHTLISGAYLGHPYHACASGTILLDNLSYSFRQQLNTSHLSAEDVSAVSVRDSSDIVLARYTDTGLPAIVRNNHVIFVGFPLETADLFDTLYLRLMQP